MATKLRLISTEADIRATLQALHDAPGIRVVDTSGARPTHYGEGVRVYAVVETVPVHDATEVAIEITETWPPDRPR